MLFKNITKTNIIKQIHTSFEIANRTYVFWLTHLKIKNNFFKYKNISIVKSS